jgi:hypothetical protein
MTQRLLGQREQIDMKSWLCKLLGHKFRPLTPDEIKDSIKEYERAKNPPTLAVCKRCGCKDPYKGEEVHQ